MIGCSMFYVRICFVYKVKWVISGDNLKDWFSGSFVDGCLRFYVWVF